MNNQRNEICEEKRFEMYFENQRPEMFRYIPPKVSRVLDVGCSNESFGQCLKLEHSVEVWGIEPNEPAAEITVQKLDKVICNIFTRDLDPPKRYFDCVVFNDVLEHLVDPYDALLYAKQFLQPQGVVTSIPNVRHFDNIWNLMIHKDWKYSEWGILDKTHLTTVRTILDCQRANAGFSLFTEVKC